MHPTRRSAANIWPKRSAIAANAIRRAMRLAVWTRANGWRARCRRKPAATGKGRCANITPGDAGLGSWSEGDIAYALQSGFTPDFDSLGGSMTDVVANMTHLDEADRDAIAAYLKAVPAHPNGYPAR